MLLKFLDTLYDVIKYISMDYWWIIDGLLQYATWWETKSNDQRHKYKQPHIHSPEKDKTKCIFHNTKSQSFDFSIILFADEP